MFGLTRLVLVVALLLVLVGAAGILWNVTLGQNVSDAEAVVVPMADRPSPVSRIDRATVAGAALPLTIGFLLLLCTAFASKIERTGGWFYVGGAAVFPFLLLLLLTVEKLANPHVLSHLPDTIAAVQLSIATIVVGLLAGTLIYTGREAALGSSDPAAIDTQDVRETS